MLDFELTPHHAGLRLWGDAVGLERLYDLVHRIVADSPLIEDKEGFVLALAYDLRKAFEGQRAQIDRMDGLGQRYRLYGVEILWPVIFIQAALLREALGGLPSSRLDQAILYELEHVIASAARAALPTAWEETLHSARRAGLTPYVHLDLILGSRCLYFIETPVERRLAVLPKLMETFDLAYGMLVEQGVTPRPGVIPPSAFANDDRDWPDFAW
ncbi:DUF6904 family protein [Thiocystis violacea]|uniref:DUF6904 family protein n=1 Tax=Thiocystis violacea TaxID=13725 RepID=UPI0019042DD5|nr:hypothetical protein [Thiocystis violacea]MBK1725280.1 hypothetical protein [Thiocystis violacea]